MAPRRRGRGRGRGKGVESLNPGSACVTPQPSIPQTSSTATSDPVPVSDTHTLILQTDSSSPHAIPLSDDGPSSIPTTAATATPSVPGPAFITIATSSTSQSVMPTLGPIPDQSGMETSKMSDSVPREDVAPPKKRGRGRGRGRSRGGRREHLSGGTYISGTHTAIRLYTHTAMQPYSHV